MKAKDFREKIYVVYEIKFKIKLEFFLRISFDCVLLINVVVRKHG